MWVNRAEKKEPSEWLVFGLGWPSQTKGVTHVILDQKGS